MHTVATLPTEDVGPGKTKAPKDMPIPGAFAWSSTQTGSTVSDSTLSHAPAVGAPMTVPNPQGGFHENVDTFLRHIFGADYGEAWVTSFKHDPASSSADGRIQAIAWGGAPYEANRERVQPDANNYLCISTFRVGDDGRARRRSAMHKKTYALMIDDVGEKVPLDRIAIQPTFKVQTSPKSVQYWYVLAEPVTDGARIRATIDNLITAGLMADNKDPGMRGVNRYGRLPFGVNMKVKYKRADGSYPKVKLVESPRWEHRPTLEMFAEAFGISCEPVSSQIESRPPLPEEAEKFNTALVEALKDADLYKEDRGRGKHEITCPWVHEHTGGADNGAAVFEAGYIDTSTGEVYDLGGFKCHHAHGEEVHLKDVLTLLRNKGLDVPVLLPAVPDAALEFAADPLPVSDEELLDLPTYALTNVAPVPSVRNLVGEYEPTDTANAVRLETIAAGRVRWHHDYQKWMVFDGTCWRVDTTGKGIAELCSAVATYIFDQAAQAFRQGSEGTAKILQAWAFASRQKGKLEAMAALLRVRPGIAIMSSEVDRDPYLLGVTNGVVDLRSGTLLRPDPRRLVLSNTGLAFDPQAECPDWEPFLRAVFSQGDGTEDDSLFQYVRRFLGYCLTGLRQPELFTILHGDGSNGKSTLLTILEMILGDYVRRVDPAMFEVKGGPRDSASASPDLAVLPGARLVVTSESERGARLNMTLIKQMTGDSITARKLYAEPFTFTPTFKVLMCTNDLPVVTGTDYGTWRRIHPLPFDRQWRRPGDTHLPDTAPEADLGLLDRLREQAPGVLAWLIRAAGDFLREGLGDTPSRVTQAAERYRDDSDVFGAWVKECLRIDKDSRGFSLYTSYKTWCLDSGIRPMSAPNWKKVMSRKFGEPRTKDGKTFYQGVVLIEFGGVET